MLEAGKTHIVVAQVSVTLVVPVLLFEELPTDVATVLLSKIQFSSLEEKWVVVFTVHFAGFRRFFFYLHTSLAKVKVTGNIVALVVAVLLCELFSATVANEHFAPVNYCGAECH